MTNKRQEGTRFEIFASEYLEDLGYEILERNYRVRTGEIDLIAKEEEYYCFIEVKYRSSEGFGSGWEAVDGRKQSVITRTARFWLLEHGMDEWTPCRFDVVYVDGGKGDAYEISILRNAFEMKSLR